MKVYLSGRIKDYPNFNLHFNAIARKLRSLNFCDVVSPIELEFPPEATYEDFMRIDLLALLECDAIYMLDGWERSAGARCEHLVASMTGMKVYYEDGKKTPVSSL